MRSLGTARLYLLGYYNVICEFLKYQAQKITLNYVIG